MDLIVARFNYWVYIVLMMIGLYAMIAKNNYMKKLIGMAIFQTAIMLFYVSIGTKKGASIPILDHHGGEHGAGSAHIAGEAALKVGEAAAAFPEAAAAAGTTNPLPHVLMLTAIVVGVATLGVAMAVVQKINDQYGSIEEDEVLKRIKL